MHVVKLFSQRFHVIAPAAPGALSEAQSFLMGVAPDQKAHAKGMLSLFERYAQDGRARLTSSNFHEANKEHGIWQFIKGPLRVFCFIDPDGGLVVLSHGAVKKSQKADPQEVSQAIRLKDSYLNAKKANSIEWI